jgi:hypothetical protein
LMVAGGVVEVLLGVTAEGQALESIAQPLTAEDADSGTPARGDHRRARRSARCGPAQAPLGCSSCRSRSARRFG